MMLALITDKLQKQTLQDDNVAVTVTSVVARSTSVSCTSSFRGLRNTQGIRFSSNPTRLVKQPDKKLTVTSGNSHKLLRHNRERSKSNVGTSGCSSSGSTGNMQLSPSVGFMSTSGMHTQAVCVAHQIPLFQCSECQPVPNTPTPPKKKHCRSLSIPSDSTASGSSSNPAEWTAYGTTIWKPVATMTACNPVSRQSAMKLHGTNISISSKSVGSLFSGSQTGNGTVSDLFAVGTNVSSLWGGSGASRPVSSCYRLATCVETHSVTDDVDSKGGCHDVEKDAQNRYHSCSATVVSIKANGTSSAYRLSDSLYVVPSLSSSSPPSPVPRPASVSSGYSDGIFSPICASPWFDSNVSFSAGIGNSSSGIVGPPRRHCSSGSCSSASSGISSGSSQCTSFPNYCNLTNIAASKCSGNHSNKRISTSSAAGSVPSLLSCGMNDLSIPSSPRKQRIPRCRSQPCVMFERKCGMKRRRESDRPSLDFHKMTETAYCQSQRENTHTDFKASPPCHASRFREELECAVSLVPIASSPLDNDIPIRTMELPRSSPIKESSSRGSVMLCAMTMYADNDNDDDTDNNSIDSDDCRRGGRNDGQGDCCELDVNIFPIVDLDLEQIENH